jgi:hypothetical protein
MLIIVAGAILRQCDRKKLKEITSEQLRPGEKTAIIIGSNSGSVVAITHGTPNRHGIRTPLLRGRDSQSTPDTATVIERTDGARGIRISIGDTGTVSIIARTRGFCFEPGFGAYTASSNSRIFVDVQWLFARRHGVNSGIGLGLRGRLEPTAFIAYSYNFWSNTSLLIGYDTKNEVLAGVRVKF